MTQLTTMLDTAGKHAMKPVVTPLSEKLGAEITGFDVRSLGGVYDASWVVELLDENHMIVFRDQELTPDDLIAFSLRFGPVQKHFLEQFRLPSHPEVYVLSNIVDNGRSIGNANEGITWHTDLSSDSNARVYTALYGLEIPTTGGDTLFANMEKAWDALPPERQRELEALQVVTSYAQLYNSRMKMLAETGVANEYEPLSEEKLAQARASRRSSPFVRVHPNTGRKAMYPGTLSVEGFEGMPQNEGLKLMEELVDYAVGEPFRYAHKWRRHDLVMWDNRGLMHVATPYDKANDRRLVYRMSIEGMPPL